MNTIPIRQDKRFRVKAGNGYVRFRIAVFAPTPAAALITAREMMRRYGIDPDHESIQISVVEVPMLQTSE